MDDKDFHHPVIVVLTIIMVLVITTIDWLHDMAVKLWAPSDSYDWDNDEWWSP